MFQADPRGILAFFAVAMCWGLAIVLFRVGLPGSVARKLGLLLVFEGLTLGSSDALFYIISIPYDEFFTRYPWADKVQWIIHAFGDCGMIALYPPFLAAALQTKLTRPFAKRSVRNGLLAAVVVIYFLVLLTPMEIGISLLYISMTAVFSFALVASIQAWVQAEGIARSRALIFMLAFGFRDICWGYIYSRGLFEIWMGAAEQDTGTADFSYFAYVLGTLVAVPLIAYGILRTQLFDIDLRIRWTIKQSTLGAFIVAIMFMLSEGAERLLSADMGNIESFLVAAVIVVFLTPLQRFAERVASAAMPNTQNTPEYKTGRKKQVYESAVSEALLDGGISPKERTLLNHLRDSLGVTEADAGAIESQLQAQLSA